MKPILIIFLICLALTSCKKKEVLPECHGMALEGEFEIVVGTWRWYSTSVKEWFDNWPDEYHFITPSSEGFDYYFTITADGNYRGYRDGILVHEHILTNGKYYSGSYNSRAWEFNYDCLDFKIDFSTPLLATTFDTLRTYSYPINFLDIDNKMKSTYNYFVRE